MTTVAVTAEPRRTTALTHRMSARENLVTLALAMWLIGGVFVDGWAHNSGVLVDSFFTPWHAMLYSGFAACATWIGASVWRRRATSDSWTGAIPNGYGSAVVGVLLFLASGAGDMTWHLTLGIERSISALLSPTHLGLFVGGLLIITAPLRAAWDDPELDGNAGLVKLLPAIGTASLAGCLTIFILQDYAQISHNEFVTVNRAIDLSFVHPATGLTANLNIRAGIAAFILGSLTMFGPLLLLGRRFRISAAAVAVVMGVQVVLLQAVTGFEDPGLVALGLVGTGLVAAAARGLRPAPWRRTPTLVFAAIAPVLFWGVFLLGIDIHDGGLGWKPELWGGGLVWSALSVVAAAWALTAPRPATTTPQASRSAAAVSCPVRENPPIRSGLGSVEVP